MPLRHLFKFSYTGLIAWIDILFALSMLYPFYLCLQEHRYATCLAPLGVGIIFVLLALPSFSVARQIRNLPHLPWLLTAAGIIHLAFCLLVSFGSSNPGYFLLFLLLSVGNFTSSLPKRNPAPHA